VDQRRFEQEVFQEPKSSVQVDLAAYQGQVGEDELSSPDLQACGQVAGEYARLAELPCGELRPEVEVEELRGRVDPAAVPSLR
jgi:hypothetical protein